MGNVKAADEDSFDSRNHPFLCFLERYLLLNPVNDASTIKKAAQFWKVKMDEVDRLMEQIQREQLTPEASPIKRQKQEMDSEQEEEEEEEEQEQELSAWVERQVTFYDGLLSPKDTKQMRKIQARFENHDRQNTTNCVIM